MTYHVAGIGFECTCNLSLVAGSSRLAWHRDQALVSNLKLNAGSHTAVLLLNTCGKEGGTDLTSFFPSSPFLFLEGSHFKRLVSPKSPLFPYLPPPSLIPSGTSFLPPSHTRPLTLPLPLVDVEGCIGVAVLPHPLQDTHGVRLAQEGQVLVTLVRGQLLEL